MVDELCLELIKKYCQGKTNVRLSVGTVRDEIFDINVFGADGEQLKTEPFIYEIGSITKTFTTALMAKMNFHHQLNVGDPISNYIRYRGRAPLPTFEQLATHTAGYATYDNATKILLRYHLAGGYTKHSPYYRFSTRELRRKLKPRYPAGTWRYSDLGIGVLGYTLGQIAGSDYYTAISDFIVHDLEMYNTYWGNETGKNLCGYDADNRPCGNWNWRRDNALAPALALSSTCHDMLVYAGVNMREELIYLSTCHKPRVDVVDDFAIGYGWIVDKDDGVIWHNGKTGCFECVIAMDKKYKIASVVMSNYNNPSEVGINQIAFALLDIERQSAEERRRKLTSGFSSDTTADGKSEQ